MEVDAGGILHMTLKTTAHAAPETAILCGIQAIGSCLQWGEVANHGTLWILLTKDMIIERTLIIIGYLARWIPREEVVGKLQEIEGTTVLTVIAREMLALFRWFEEMLLIRQLTCYKGMVIDQGPEEEFGSLATILGTKHLIIASLSQEFWDESIGMIRAQVRVASLQWVYLLVVIEIASQPRLLLLFCSLLLILMITYIRMTTKLYALS